MLTRSEVARRLGRSVTTVRRIEGELLFPEVDERGIYRFDEASVDALGEAVRRGDVQLWREVSGSPNDWRCWLTRATRPASPQRSSSVAPASRSYSSACSQCADFQRRAANLGTENKALRDLVHRVVEIAVHVSPTTVEGKTLARRLLELVEEL